MLNYAHEIDPDIEGINLTILVIIGPVAIIFAIISLVGLLIFKHWAKPLYLASFLFLPLYPFTGVTVYSGVSRIFYALSIMSSGAVLALLYFSSVSKYYQKKFNKSDK
ncbi:MAG: hypothetical protein ACI82Z_000613 [Cellvibrionaceae bacterium]